MRERRLSKSLEDRVRRSEDCEGGSNVGYRVGVEEIGIGYELNRERHGGVARIGESLYSGR